MLQMLTNIRHWETAVSWRPMRVRTKRISWVLVTIGFQVMRVQCFAAGGYRWPIELQVQPCWEIYHRSLKGTTISTAPLAGWPHDDFKLAVFYKNDDSQNAAASLHVFRRHHAKGLTETLWVNATVSKIRSQGRLSSHPIHTKYFKLEFLIEMSSDCGSLAVCTYFTHPHTLLVGW